MPTVFGIVVLYFIMRLMSKGSGILYTKSTSMNSVSTSPVSPNPDNVSGEGSILKFIAGMMIGIFILASVLLILNALHIISLGSLFPAQKKKAAPYPSQAQNVEPPVGTSSDKVIAKVGEEVLYQKDLDIEDKNYPEIPSKTRKLLVDKLVKDSVVLQAGQADGLVQLDASIYNSPDKDYKKRVAKVAEIRKILEKRQDMITGNVISIWFYNSSAPTAMDPLKAKEFAKSKITPLHEAVKNKQMTIQQAAEKIKNDESLAQIDRVYKINAIYDFAVNPNEKISYDPVFDAKVKQLSAGQVSELYMGRDYDAKTHQLRDAIYMFAQVKEKNIHGNLLNYDQWYAQKQKNYAITVY